MRVAAVVIAVLLVLLGAIWIGQGLGFIRGSFMTGEPMWAWIGAAVAIAGVGLGLIAAYWRRGPGRV